MSEEFDIFSDRDRTMEDAVRQFTICNACRYCEGYCPVWPEVHSGNIITRNDVLYYSNLCYDHRDCYYACPYVPDAHEFKINIPEVTRKIRKKTYEELTFNLNISLEKKIALSLILVVPIMLGWIFTFNNIYSPGPISFYKLVPKYLLIAVSSILSLYLLSMLAVAGIRYRRLVIDGLDRGDRNTGVGIAGITTLLNVLAHKWFRKIHYPGEKESNVRFGFHLLIFYGFLMDILSTTLGFIYEDILAIPSPFPFNNPAVIAGVTGGLMLTVGGLLGLVARFSSWNKQPFMTVEGFDFLLILEFFVVALTGLLTLLFRYTAGSEEVYLMLLIHYSAIYTMYITAPFSTNVLHIIVRLMSLNRFNNHNIP